MIDPTYSSTIIVGGNGSSYFFNAFPKEMHSNQSFILSNTHTASGGGGFDISGATATLYVSAYKDSTYTPVALGSGTLSDSGSGTTDTVTFTVAKNLIPTDLGSYSIRNGGNAVFYYILEDADSILEFSEGVNIIDPAFGLDGESEPSAGAIVVQKNDLGSVEDTTVTTPPSPDLNVAYIVGVGSTGDWAGQDNNLAIGNGSAWIFTAPSEGNFVFDKAADAQKVFDGSTWSPVGLADGSVTQAKLAPGFTLPDDNVTNTQLADMAQDTIKGRFSAGTGDPEDLTTGSVRTMLAISNVDNTSDVDKPVSTAQQAAIDLKLDATATAADSLQINGIDVNNTNISNGRVLAYNAGNTELEYVDQAAGGGGAGVTYPFIFSTDITATDPTSGGVKYNSATVASVTQIYISATANNNVDATTLLNSLGSGDSFYIQQSDTDSKHILVDITGVTDNTGWFTLDVTVASAGTLIDNAAAAGTIFNYVSGGAGSGVTSAFGRTGAVAAAASDYDASQVDNDSIVTGAFVSDALDTLQNAKMDEATYNAAGISEQLVGLTATQSMTNKTVNGVSLVSSGGATQVLYDDGLYRVPPGASGGEANTASNTGLGDAGLFKQKAGVDLEFKDLVGGTNCTITSQADTVTINATGESNSASNLAGGEGLFAQKNGIDLEFKSLVAGTNVSLVSDANSVTINTTNTGEANTASNTGAGAQLAKAKSGTDLPFRTLTSSDSTITITQNTDTVDLTGGGYPRGKVTGLATTGTVNIDWSLGDHFVVGTMTGNMTLTFSNVTQGQPISIDITGASAYTLTMPASVNIALEGTTFTADVRNLIHLKAVDAATSQEVVYSVLTASAAGGGILPSANATKTGNYTIVAGDIGNRIILGSGATADSTFTLDVSLLADDTEQISFVNKSAYRLEILVSNTSTMKINDVAINRFLFKGDGVLTLNGDSATNCDIVAG